MTLTATGPARPVHVTAQPYPGMPTDLQAQWMAVLALARGRSRVRDRVFPSRLVHVGELNRLGACIEARDGTALIKGVEHLSATHVTASDLRASAALVLAGLAAEGETILHHVHHLDRGYEQLDQKLLHLGAAVQRVPGTPVESVAPLR